MADRPRKRDKLKDLFYKQSQKDVTSTQSEPEQKDKQPVIGAESKTRIVVADESNSLAPPPNAQITELWDQAYSQLDSKLRCELERCIQDAPTGNAPAKTTGQKMMAIVKAKMKEMEDGRWKLGFGEHNLLVKDLIEPVSWILEHTKEYVGSAVEASMPASTVWAGICLLLPLALRPSEQGEALVEGLLYITALMSRCSMREIVFQNRYDHAKRDKPDHGGQQEYFKNIEALYLSILKFQASAVHYIGKNSVLQYSRDISKWDDWVALLEHVKTSENNLKQVEKLWKELKLEEEWTRAEQRQAENIDLARLQLEESERLRTLIDMEYRKEDRKKLLNWLSSLDVSTNFNACTNAHQPGTGDWLLDHDMFIHWEAHKATSLWLHGQAGGGKSFLSSRVISYLRENYGGDAHAVIAYFYFDFREAAKQSPDNMIAEIIKQICAHRPDTPRCLLDLQKTMDLGQRPSRRSLIDLLHVSMEDFRDIFIVLDALDECPQGALRDALLAFIVEFRQPNIENLHIFMTSRDEEDIREEIKRSSTEPCINDIDLMEVREVVNEDIEDYIDGVLAHGRFKDSPKICAEIKQALTAKADGIIRLIEDRFQYVHLQLESFQSQHLNLRNVKAVLEALPKGLDEAYSATLLRVPKEQREVAQRALQWICLCSRALSPAELTDACAITLDDNPTFNPDERAESHGEILRMLPSLVHLISEYDYQRDTDRNVLKLTHFSVKEFLTSSRVQRTEAKEFFIDEQNVRQKLCNALLSYHLHMSRSVGVPDSDSSNNFTSLDDFERMYPLWKSSFYRLNGLLEGIHFTHLLEVTKDGLLECLAPASTSLYFLYYLHSRPIMDYLQERLPPANLFVDCKDGHLSSAHFIALHGLDHIMDIMLQLPEIAAETFCSGSGSYRTPLMAAIRNRNYRMVDMLLQPRAYMKAQYLLSAEDLRSSDPIRKQEQAAAKYINIRGREGSSALHEAAALGRLDYVQHILELGADIDAQAGTYDSALTAAAFWGKLENVKFLIESGADVNAQAGPFGSALAIAAAFGKLEIVEFLIESGADIDVRSDECETVLQIAVDRGKLETVRLLIKEGADVNAHGGANGTALEIAKRPAKYKRQEDDREMIIQILVDAGATDSGQVD